VEGLPTTCPEPPRSLCTDEVVPGTLARPAPRPQTDGILESSLYVSDVPRSVPFYQETFGFAVISEFGERGCAMQAGKSQVLLLFRKGASRAISSPHDGTANYISRLQSQPPNWPTGSRCCKREGSQWKRSASGIRAAGGSIFETGSPFNRTRHAGHLVGVLKIVGTASLHRRGSRARHFLPSTLSYWA
jgi:hypothetical protein